MAAHIKNDFITLAEEKFDFDLPLSPASDSGDGDMDDEVFVGPVGHREKCISVGIESRLTGRSSGSSGPLLSLELGSWSPLSGDKFEQIIQEAHMLVQRIGKNNQDTPAAEGVESGSAPTPAPAASIPDPTPAAPIPDPAPAASIPDPAPAAPTKTTEQFAEDPTAKLSALEPPPGPSLSPIKRETFCVQDSPMKQLPPAIQQHLLKAGRVNSPGGARTKARPCSPVQASQPKVPLRGKVGLSGGGKGLLPNRPAVPGVSLRSRTKLPPPESTRLPPSDKGRAGLGWSPSRCPPSSAGSSEDLLSDVSLDSLNTSLPERRVLPGPRKVRQPLPVKAVPGLRIPDRRMNTSSSSSSVSSLNSSLSVSPSGKGAFNTSLSSGVGSVKLKGSVSASRLPGSGIAASSKPRVSSIGTRASEAARPGKPVPSAQVKRSAEPLAGPAKSNPATKRDPVTPNLTPAKRTVQRAGSVPNVSSVASAKAANPKQKSLITPTVTSQAKGPRRSEVSSPNSSRIMKPKKLVSASSTESVLQKSVLPAPESLQSPLAGRKSVSALPRRSSALPTPVNRRVSGIPMMTPKSMRAGPAGERPGLPASARKISQASPVQLKVTQQPSGLGPEATPRDGSCDSGLQPGSLAFCLDDEPGEALGAGPAPDTSGPASQGTAGHPIGHDMKDGDIPDLSSESHDAPESSLESRETPDSSLESQKTPESSLESQKTEFSTEGQSTHTSCTKNMKTLESNKENNNSCTRQQVQKPQNDAAKTPENKEVLLVDAPAPVLKPEERLLIDLSNSPDLVKTVPLKPIGGQLIDLSSPLITWSPADKKGNTADSPPLINLSF